MGAAMSGVVQMEAVDHDIQWKSQTLPIQPFFLLGNSRDLDFFNMDFWILLKDLGTLCFALEYPDTTQKGIGSSLLVLGI